MKAREKAVLDRELAQLKRIVRVLHSRACPCGQELDICQRSHCPRCGKTLSHHH